jgi:antitoxin HicB
MPEYSFTVLFQQVEERRYVATCPALPGLVTEGETLEKARTMAHDAVHAYVESLHKNHLPIPPDKPPVQEEIRVLLAETG